jgi:hypothetical protein
MDFVPEVSALDPERTIEIDEETKEMLRKMNLASMAGLVVSRVQA